MEIPFATIERLATYLRCLRHLKDEKIKIISSADLATNTKTSPEQVRKDLSYFGRFGKVGTGYYVGKLAKKIEKILKKRKKWNVCIVGAGSLGSALARYGGFKDSGYNVVALFDNNPEKIGTKIGDAEIYDVKLLPEIVNEKKIDILALTVPKHALPGLKELLESSKVKGILNFVPLSLHLKTRRKAAVLDVDLAQKMYILSYLISNKEEQV